MSDQLSDNRLDQAHTPAGVEGRLQQVRQFPPQHTAITTWLRDEEAGCGTPRYLRSCAAGPSTSRARIIACSIQVQQPRHPLPTAHDRYSPRR